MLNGPQHGAEESAPKTSILRINPAMRVAPDDPQNASPAKMPQI
jgi:hypothetical protein